ncbi:MAG: hypothetical protein U1E42_10195 [Rhodospirillales bacterium]
MTIAETLRDILLGQRKVVVTAAGDRPAAVVRSTPAMSIVLAGLGQGRSRC